MTALHLRLLPQMMESTASYPSMGKVDISSVVCRKPELEWIFADGDCQARLMMIFSAKEAVYKALHPVCRKYIDFQDVELSWVPEESRFVVRFSAAFEERFLVNR